jgi:hypothetical protein
VDRGEGGRLDRRTYGRRVGVQTGWRYLRRLDWRRYRPRPQHVKADPEAQAAFKQTR